VTLSVSGIYGLPKRKSIKSIVAIVKTLK
jgi:hypothetical protein